MLTNRLENIEQKIRQLAKKMEQLQQLNVALEDENRKLKSNLAVLKEELNNQANTHKAAVAAPQQAMATAPTNTGTDDKRSKQLKKEIEQYIKEIDKCIEWLQNN